MTNNITRVLLVEDEEDARDILAFYLNKIFEEVIIAQDGQKGYDIVKSNYEKSSVFDIIITDIKMPNKDGMTMIDEINQLLPEQKYIIISAYKDEEYLFRSIGLNVLGYFVKPLDVERILNMLTQFKSQLILKEKNEISKKLIKINQTYDYDKITNILYKNEKIVRLSKKEISLVKILTDNMDSIVTKEMIKESIWDNINTSDTTMRTVIKRVKDKIKDDDFIISRKGYGYIIEHI